MFVGTPFDKWTQFMTCKRMFSPQYIETLISDNRIPFPILFNRGAPHEKKSHPFSQYFHLMCVHMAPNTDAGVQMRQIEAMGISTQRGTFTTWDR